jgi:hypothetical protein
VVLAATLVVAAVAATAAFGAVGEITKASVASDWSSGSFAGQMEWTGCAHLPPPLKEPGPSGPFTCTWTAYATVGPGTSPEACLGSGRDLNSLGSGVELVWQGEARTGDGSEAFEVSDFPLDGSGEKVLCLATREESTDGTELPCIPPFEIPPGWHCPYVMTNYFSNLDSRVLEAEAESGPKPKPEPAPKPEAEAGSKSEPSEPCACPGVIHRHHHHYARRRHRHIFVSQHEKVPEA